MRAFLSHSSRDNRLVRVVHEALGRSATWLDAVEIELGEVLVERIATAIEESADFVLFWSRDAAESAWVRQEIHMGFIRSLRDKALRFIVIRLDQTPLPLYLQPYLFLDVSESQAPADQIIEALTKTLTSPAPAVRHRFINRNQEIERIEQIVDSGQCSVIFLRGIQGIGKRSLVTEALRRLYAGTDNVEIRITDGMGPVELALLLCASTSASPPREGATTAELQEIIALQIEIVLRAGRLLIFEDVQHWLGEDGRPSELLSLLVRRVASIPAAKQHPLFMTTTRRVRNDTSENPGTAEVTVDGLPNDHLATLLQVWHQLTSGRELSREAALRLTDELRGYPLAARLAAPLIASFGEDYLRDNPREIILLRRDLARLILNEIELSNESILLMEGLAVIRTPVRAGTLATGLRMDDKQLQSAITQCVDAGLVRGSPELVIHPLVEDHFWNRHLHRANYKELAARLADALWQELQGMEVGTMAFATMLPSVFRLFALAGDIGKALQLRRDLRGALSDAAITLYRRRDYQLAKAYAQHILDDDPQDWQMRLLVARIAIREEDWQRASQMVDQMLTERPGDIAVRHARGWQYLRMRRFDQALAIFTSIIAEREHVRSLQAAADCLYQLHRNPEALALLERAKAVESANPYILELEARIREAEGDLGGALVSTLGAANRDPGNWSLRHRIGQIRSAMNDFDGAIADFRQAAHIAPTEVTPRVSLVDALLNRGLIDEAEDVLGQADLNARNRTQRAVNANLRARILRSRGRLEEAETLLEREVTHGTNEPHQSRLLAQVEIDLARRRLDENFKAIAQTHLNKARIALRRVRTVTPDSPSLAGLQGTIDELDGRL